MNWSFDGGSRVHRGLRLTPVSELVGSHARGWLRPRGLAGMASTQRGASGEPHRGLLQWLDGEVRPVTKRNELRWWCSVWGEWRHREVKQKVGRGAVGCCSARGAFYRPGRQWRGGEAAGSGGCLIPVGFDIESGRVVDKAPS
jgi:hypothetical protein